MLRRYLKPALEAAGIEAGDLFIADATRMRIDWRRATRDTGITWRAMRGDSPIKIMRAAGHRDIKTTMRYVVEAEGLGASADAFPPLPPSLFKPPRSARGVSASVSAFRPGPIYGTSRKALDSVARVGFETVETSAPNVADRRVNDADPTTQGDAKQREVSASVSVEDILGAALLRASEAGRWDVVAQLAKELEARRLAAAGNVVALNGAKRVR
jgi:hypothetical protein